MTAMTFSLTDAPSATVTDWDIIVWPIVERVVSRLQRRIAKATREENKSKAKALQWILTHSFYGKLIAVKRVTQSRGHKAAGVDGVIWLTSNSKNKGSALAPAKGVSAPGATAYVYFQKERQTTSVRDSIDERQSHASVIFVGS